MKKTFFFLSFLLIAVVINIKAQPALVKAIPKASTLFFKANGSLYFFSGDTLWKSGGTSATTVMVKKLGEGQDLYPDVPTIWNNKFYFTTRLGNTVSLWKSDGTAANTVKIATYDFLRILTTYNNNLILRVGPSYGSSLWKMNASEQFTLIKEMDEAFQQAKVANGKLYFTANYETSELWVTDGTTAGTHLVFNANSRSGYIRSLNTLNDSLYPVVAVALGEYPDELYKANESNAKSIWVSSQRGLSMDYTTIHKVITKQGKLSLFTKDGDELWEFDPATNKVSNIASLLKINNNRNYRFYLSPVVATDSVLLFNSGGKLYRSTGPNEKTYTIGNIFHETDPKLTVVGNKVFYINHSTSTPSTYAQEFELYQSGLYKENTKPLRSIFPGGTTYGHSDNLIELNGKLYFTTKDASGNLSLWIYDPEKPSGSTPYFTLVDADTDLDLQWIKEGDTIIKNINQNISVRYNAVGTPGSVKFKLGNSNVRTENSQPFSLAGDSNGDYASWTGALPGSYKLTGTPYSLSGGGGSAGSSLITNFVIKAPAPKIPPYVNAGPDQEITIPLDSIFVFATSGDTDGHIIEREWELYSSPDQNSWANYFDRDTVIIWLYDPGIYKYIYSVRDNDNLVSRDTLVVKVNDARAKVKGFVLVNADTDTDIKNIGYYEELDLSTLPPHLTIRVKTEPENLDKVIIINDGVTARTETAAPYSLFGDSNGNFASGNFSEGSHYISAIPYLDNIENPWGNLSYRIKRSIPGPLLNFVLVDATTDTDIIPIGENGNYWLDDLPENLNIRVETNGSPVGSVRIKLDSQVRSENVAPYSLFGDNNGNFNAGILANGFHTLEAIAYSGPNGTGNFLNGIFIKFRIIGTDNTRTEAYSTSNAEFSASPNPSASVFNLNVFSEEQDHLSVEISKADGTMIEKLFEGNVNEGSDMALQWNAFGYPAGVYFCTMKKSKEQKVYRLVVVK